MIHTYSFPTTIHSGPGARHRIGEVLRSLGIQRPMILTDRQLVKLPPTSMLTDALDRAGIAAPVCASVEGNPTVSQAEAGAAFFKAGLHDGIIAFGGGAPLDVAKCVAVLAHHPGHLLEYEDGRPGGRSIDQILPPIVAIPTTAGTGSEVGRSAVVSEDESKVKRIIFSPRLLPQVVLADAELTLGLPAGVTAATGMDALTHLIEAFLAQGHHPLAEGIALEGLRIVAQNLKQATAFARNPAVGPHEAHLHCRQNMLEAAMMGAVAFQKGLGVTHSLAHALSTVCDLHHGLANGILLPYTLKFNLPQCPDAFGRMAQAVGLAKATGDAFVDWVVQLKKDIGIPVHLSEVGVGPGQIEALVRTAEQDGCHSLNPRTVHQADFEALFAEALG
jgi:alcohol dehydrogenase class IV